MQDFRLVFLEDSEKSITVRSEFKDTFHLAKGAVTYDVSVKPGEIFNIRVQSWMVTRNKHALTGEWDEGKKPKYVIKQEEVAAAAFRQLSVPPPAPIQPPLTVVPPEPEPEPLEPAAAAATMYYTKNEKMHMYIRDHAEQIITGNPLPSVWYRRYIRDIDHGNKKPYCDNSFYTALRRIGCMPAKKVVVKKEKPLTLEARVKKIEDFIVVLKAHYKNLPVPSSLNDLLEQWG